MQNPSATQAADAPGSSTLELMVLYLNVLSSVSKVTNNCGLENLSDLKMGELDQAIVDSIRNVQIGPKTWLQNNWWTFTSVLGLSTIDQHWSTPEVRSQLIAADMPFHNIVLNDGNKVRGLIIHSDLLVWNTDRSQPLPLEPGARNSKAKISTNTSNWL